MNALSPTLRRYRCGLMCDFDLCESCMEQFKHDPHNSQLEHFPDMALTIPIPNSTHLDDISASHRPPRQRALIVGVR